jgi:hypothetical protein
MSVNCTIKYFILIFVTVLITNSPAQEDRLKFGWTPNTEVHLAHYIMYRDTIPGTFVMLDVIPKSESTYTDNTAQPGVTYYYKLTAADSLGFESEPSNEIIAKAGSGVNEDKSNEYPENFILRQNYPNPFNPTTTIEYSIPNHSLVVINIFNVLGQNVRNLVNEFKEAGVYKIEWDGKSNYENQVPSAIYFYQMIAGDFKQVRKLILQK